MKYFLIFFLLLPLLCGAHPGTGIVADSKGNIFYTDLSQIWKIYPDGHKEVVVPEVHTHELSIDDHDNLYGQHSIYSGEATNTYSYYVWRLNAAGRLDTIIPLTEGFYIEEYSFVRDKDNNLYWISHGNKIRIMKKTAEGPSVALAEGDFKDVQWMYADKGKLYFIKQSSIYVLDSQNKVAVYAKNLTGKPEKHNALFGLWSDVKGNLYTGNIGQRKVQQIDTSGVVRNYYFSEKDWMPSGGVFDRQGNFWVMEYSPQNEVRVKKAEQTKTNEQAKPSHSFNNGGWVLLLILVPLVLLLLLFQKMNH